MTGNRATPFPAIPGMPPPPVEHNKKAARNRAAFSDRGIAWTP